MATAKPCRVWSKFSSKTSAGEYNFRIQDMPSDRLEEVLKLFYNYFMPEETMHKVSGIATNEESHNECLEMIREMITESTEVLITICCLNEDPEHVGDIVGGSFMALNTKDDKDEDLDIPTRTKELGKMFEILGHQYSLFDAMKVFKLDKFYDGRGIVVHPDYRGRGIAQRLLNSRRLICKEEGVPMTGAWVTTFGSQKAAARDNWETAFEISYEEFGKKHSLNFENVPPTCKYVIARI